MSEPLRRTPENVVSHTPGAESCLYFMGGADASEVAEKIITGKYTTDKGPISVVSVQYAVPVLGKVAHYRTYARTSQGLYAGISGGALLDSKSSRLENLPLITTYPELADALFDETKAIKKGSLGGDLFGRYMTHWKQDASKLHII